MERNLSLDFVRVTESAAISASKWMGKGDEKSADRAAVEEMRARFNMMDIKGRIVIGEGERDEAPMLFIGEEVGNGKGPAFDIAVDPLEGTTITALGGNNAISVLAAGPKGSLLNAPDIYMDKIAVGPDARGVIDIDADVEENLKAVAKATGKPLEEVTAIILDRERHAELIKKVRKVGCRIRLIRDGDIAGAIAAVMPGTGVDILLGVGGAPEGVISAVAVKCLGGEMQARLVPRNDADVERAKKMGIEDINRKLLIEDLAKGSNLVFAATGVTDGTILRGVNFTSFGCMTHSVVMRVKSGTVRFIEARHVFKD